MPVLGERFRAAREARGLSLSDVAEQIRIRSVYLAAIEDENWSAIGAAVYARGFLRTYARFLGLDAEDVVAEFNARPPDPLSVSETPVEPEAESPIRTGRLAPAIVLSALVAVVLIAFVVFNEFTLRERTPPGAAAAVVSSTQPAASGTPSALVETASPAPADSGSPVKEAASEGAQTIAIRLSSPSWLRVTVDGNVSMEGTFPAGTARLFHGKSARLRIGNAGGVEVLVDGKSLGRLGANGDVVERSFAL